jgi:hypothetical protein
MARVRRARNQLGKPNLSRRFMFGGYTFARANMVPILKAIAGWAFLEVTEGWRSWFGHRRTQTVTSKSHDSESEMSANGSLQPAPRLSSAMPLPVARD